MKGMLVLILLQTASICVRAVPRYYEDRAWASDKDEIWRSLVPELLEHLRAENTMYSSGNLPPIHEMYGIAPETIRSADPMPVGIPPPLRPRKGPRPWRRLPKPGFASAETRSADPMPVGRPPIIRPMRPPRPIRRPKPIKPSRAARPPPSESSGIVEAAAAVLSGTLQAIQAVAAEEPVAYPETRSADPRPPIRPPVRPPVRPRPTSLPIRPRPTSPTRPNSPRPNSSTRPLSWPTRPLSWPRRPTSETRPLLRPKPKPKPKPASEAERGLGHSVAEAAAHSAAAAAAGGLAGAAVSETIQAIKESAAPPLPEAPQEPPAEPETPAEPEEPAETRSAVPQRRASHVLKEIAKHLIDKAVEVAVYEVIHSLTHAN